MNLPTSPFARSIPAPASGVLLRLFRHHLAFVHYAHGYDIPVTRCDTHGVRRKLGAAVVIELHRAALAAVRRVAAALAANTHLVSDRLAGRTGDGGFHLQIA